MHCLLDESPLCIGPLPCRQRRPRPEFRCNNLITTLCARITLAIKPHLLDIRGIDPQLTLQLLRLLPARGRIPQDLKEAATSAPTCVGGHSRGLRASCIPRPRTTTPKASKSGARILFKPVSGLLSPLKAMPIKLRSRPALQPVGRSSDGLLRPSSLHPPSLSPTISSVAQGAGSLAETSHIPASIQSSPSPRATTSARQITN